MTTGAEGKAVMFVADMGLFGGSPPIQCSTNFQESRHTFAGQFIIVDICSVPVKPMSVMNVYRSCNGTADLPQSG
jgi:hypothetical protein